jgi:hypothetical protein
MQIMDYKNIMQREGIILTRKTGLQAAGRIIHLHRPLVKNTVFKPGERVFSPSNFSSQNDKSYGQNQSYPRSDR